MKINSIIDHLEYTSLRFRYPVAHRLGFLSQGFAISARFRRANSHWKSHLGHCFKEEKLWAKKLSCDEIIVLGAGRLHDVDLLALAPCAKSILLVDADPSCVKTWKCLSKSFPETNIRNNICDISGAIYPWFNVFRSNLRSINDWDAAMDCLRRLPEQVSANIFQSMSSLTQAQHTSILSINILSQIPIVWQDIVEKELILRFGRNFCSAREEQWLKAFSVSGGLLVENHLKLLNESSARNILLITDLEYGYYMGDVSFGDNIGTTSAPFQWSNGQWVRDSTIPRDLNLTLELYKPLFGIDLEDEATRSRYFSNYSSRQSNTWLWHIAPLGIEEKERGTIHRVSSLVLEIR